MKTVVIVGLGSLGCLSSRIEKLNIKLRLIDRDFVDERNLKRQVLYTKKDIGKLKVQAAYEKLKNKNIQIYPIDLTNENVDILKSDLVLDCTDNLETRFLINDYCSKNKIPWIFASALGNKGMCFSILKKPCLRCFLKEPTETLGTCETEGISLSILKKISTIQVQQAKRILENKKPEYKLININGNKITKIKIEASKSCPTCNKNYEYLEGKNKKEFIKLCGTNNFQIKGKFNLKKLKERLSKLDKVTVFNDYINFRSIFIFEDRVIIKARTKEEARTIFDKYLL